MALVNVSMPGNANAFYMFLLRVANVDIIPTDDIYATIFPSTSSDDLEPLYPNLKYIGMDTTIFLNNLGSLFFMIVLYPFLVVIFYLGKKMPLKTKGFKSKLASLDTVLFWNSPIMTITESYSIITMSVFVNLKAIDWDQNIFALSSAFTILFFIIVFGYPVLVLYVLQRNFLNLS